MKIAVPIETIETTMTVSASFGRATHFLIYDEESAASQTLENTAALSAGGAGIQAAQLIVDSGAQVLLAPRCGQNAANVLLAAGIRLYKSIPGLSAMGNVKAFKEGKLDELSEIHEGFHGHKEK